MTNKTIRLLDCDIQVKFCSPGDMSSDTAIGRYDIKDGSIKIRNDMPPDIAQAVFFHELVHAIALMNSMELSEQDVDGIALGIRSFLENNETWRVTNPPHTTGE